MDSNLGKAIFFLRGQARYIRKMFVIYRQIFSTMYSTRQASPHSERIHDSHIQTPNSPCPGFPAPPVLAMRGRPRGRASRRSPAARATRA